MIPIRLELTNFLSYGTPTQTLDFSTFHVACITGANGHGKSALVEAITYALYGEARKLGAARTAAEGLLHLGANEMRVVFEFEMEGTRYRVDRSYRTTAKTGTARLELQTWDGAQWHTLSQRGAVRDTQEILNGILRMTYATLISSAFLCQGRADEFTRKTAGDRKAVLAEILDLSRYATLQELARDRAREEEEDAALKRAKVAHLEEATAGKEETAAKLKDCAAVTEQRQAVVKDAEAWQEKAGKDLARLEADEKAAAEVQGRLVKTDGAREEAQAEATAAQKEADACDAILERRAEIEGAHRRHEAVTEQLTVLADKAQQAQSLQARKADLARAVDAHKAQARSDLKAAEAALATAKEAAAKTGELNEALGAARSQAEESERLDGEITTAREKYAEGKAGFAELGRQLKALILEEGALVERRVKLLETEAVICPTCGTDLDDEHRAIALDTLEAQFAKVHERVEQNKDQTAQAKLALESLESQGKDLCAIRDKLGATAGVLARVEQQLANANAAAEASGPDGPLTQEVKARALALGARAAEQDTLDGVQADLVALAYDPDAYQALEQERKTLAGAGADMERLTSAAERIREARRRHEAARRRALDLQDEAAVLRDKADQLKYATDQAARRRQEAEQHRAVLEQARSALGDAIQERARLQASCEQIAQAEAAMEAERRHLAAAEQEARVYRELVTAYGRDGIQALVIEQAIPEIEAEANDILERLTGGKTRIALESLREKKGGGTAETLDIRISDEMGERSYEMFSGGEAFRVNFALRIGLAKLLARRAGTRLRTLVIDEGFGTQDAEGLEHLVEAIQAIAPDFDKLLVITHVDSLKAAFPTQINVTKTAAGSKLTVAA